MNATRSTVAIACLTIVLITACSSSPHSARVVPAAVQKVNAELSQIQLTEAAATRTGIETTPVLKAMVGGVERLIIPYSAVMYHFDGTTWTYVSPREFTFLRAGIKIESIDGQRAILTSGPPEGTMVVRVGAAELYGVEFGVGK